MIVLITPLYRVLHLSPTRSPAGRLLKVEETGESKLLILHAESGPNAGRTIPCIYQLVGDRLRLCFGLDGTTPATFTTSAASHRYLATYRRL